MEVTEQMREVMSSRGHGENKRMSLLSMLYIFLTVLFISDTILDICILWDQFDKKIFRFKNINMLICGLAYPLIEKNTFELINIAEERKENFGLKVSEERRAILAKLDAESKKINKLTYFVVIFIMGTLSVAPLLAALFIIFFRPEEMLIQELPLPITFWYPEAYANLPVYFVIYAIQIFYVYLFSGYMYCVLSSGFISLQTTVCDMKLLCLAIKEIDKNILAENRNGTVHNTVGSGTDEKKQDSSYSYTNEHKLSNDEQKSLKDFFGKIIKLHKFICRRAKGVNGGLEKMFTVWNNTICFQICVCLYTSVEVNDFVLKVEHFMLVIPLAYILFLYCSNGQYLLNECENLRRVLWESPFTDKPQWFQKSLLIMMTRTTKDLEIKPFGFYVLNLRTFSIVMNAAYSYFNMLNSLKKH